MDITLLPAPTTSTAAEFTKAIEAPVTEFALFIPKAGHAIAEVEAAIGPLAAEVNRRNGEWGVALSRDRLDENKLVLLVGWESVQVGPISSVQV